MARPRLPDLTPEQVVDLLDQVLSNADSLLASAIVLLEAGQVGRARALAILGMEESGKAIAIHERRVQMQHIEAGEPFMCEALHQLWPDHKRKLEAVHRFLTWEEYWFGTEPSNPDENAQILGTIDAWKDEHNSIKQRGFYVDLAADGSALTPVSIADHEELGSVIERVHQIGWQIRLGEHIEGKRQDEQEAGFPAAHHDEITWLNLDHVEGVSDEVKQSLRRTMLEGSPGTPLPNPAYRFNPPGADRSPFRNVGRPGYEAQTREFQRLAESLDDDKT